MTMQNFLKDLVEGKHDVEIDQFQKLAQDQVSWHNPLKPASSRELNETGAHNLKVLAKLAELKQILVDGAPRT